MTHELSLMNNLVNKIQDIARAENPVVQFITGDFE